MEKADKLRVAVGEAGPSYGGIVYFPQPDPKKFPFFSFVVPKNPREGEKVQMIWAASADDLAHQEKLVP
ncbi:hypothetical protein ACI3PL_29370, partial [Lacticaseibacillus paracasei]